MKFFSKYKEHRIVMKPETVQIIGINRVLVPGKAIEFKNNEFVTDDKETIEFLRNSKEFNKVIHEEIAQEIKEDAILKMAEEIKKRKEVKEEEVKSELICEVCGKVCKSKLGLNKHMTTHNE